MGIVFDITMLSGKEAQGRLKWKEKNLNSPAVSGPHGNGHLPMGNYAVKKKGFEDRPGNAPYCDPKNQCWFQFIQAQFETDRTDLGIHPDGNVYGTKGCIGLTDKDTSAWRQAFASITADVSLDVRRNKDLKLLSPMLEASETTSFASSWPADTQSGLEGFYGKHSLGTTGQPTAAWEKEHLTSLTLPYRMTLAWDLSATVRRLRCHKKVADSLGRIFTRILAHYGSEAEIQRHRMHLFGGCYLYRPVAGGARLSTHAWGAAIDLDPERNPLGKPWNSQDGMMPLEVVAIFEAEGWKWGGRFQGRKDCMHFQATA